MKKGDRVSFDGRAGTVVNFMPAGMIDVKFDDVGRVERRHEGRLAKANPQLTYKQLQAALKSRGLPATGTKAELEKRLAEYREGLWDPNWQRRQETARKKAEREKRRSESVKKTTRPKRVRTEKVSVKEPKVQKGPPAKRKQMLPIRHQERIPKVSVLTREDPPRFDGRDDSYCGNPIDGTAYYVFLSKKKEGRPRFIRERDLAPFVYEPEELGGAGGMRDTEEQLEAFTYDQKEKYGGFNVEVFPTATPDAPAQYIKLRPKRSEGAPKVRTEHLPTAGQEGYAGRRGPPKRGQTAPPDAVTTEGEKGDTLYWMIRVKKSPKDRLEKYSLYTQRDFLAPAFTSSDKQKAASFGMLTVAVAKGSNVGLDVAKWMIESGMVRVAIDKRALWQAWPRVNPAFDRFAPGWAISTRDKAKAKSPFYSFVESNTSPLPIAGIPYPACLGEKEEELVAFLNKGIGLLGGYQKSFEQVKRIMGSVRIGRKVYLDDPVKTLSKMFTRYAGLTEWLLTLAGDEEALELISMGDPDLEETFDIDNPNSPLTYSLSQLQGWLIGRGGSRILYRKPADFFPERGKPLSFGYAYPSPDAMKKAEEKERLSIRPLVKQLHVLLEPYPLPPIADQEIEQNWFGPTTQAAVAAYQKNYVGRVLSTGSVGETTWRALGPINRLIQYSALVGFAPRKDALLPPVPPAEKGVPMFPTRGGVSEKLEEWKSLGFPTSRLKRPANTSKEEREDQLKALWEVAFGGEKAGVSSLHTSEEEDYRRALYALVFAYYALGGWRLAGPLDPSKTPHTSPLEEAAQAVRDAASRVKGGEESFKRGGVGQEAFLTYNPLLFQLLKKTYGSPFEPLKDPFVVREIDRIGQYGAMLKLLQNLELGGDQSVSINQKLFNLFEPASRMKGRKHQMEMEKSGRYTEFLLFAPLGLTVGRTVSAAQEFVNDPIAYMRGLKARVSSSIGHASQSKVITQTKPGTMGQKEKSINLLEEDREPPYQYTADTFPVPRSSLQKAADRRKEINLYISAIDRQLKRLGVPTEGGVAPREKEQERGELPPQERRQAPLPSYREEDRPKRQGIKVDDDLAIDLLYMSPFERRMWMKDLTTAEIKRLAKALEIPGRSKLDTGGKMAALADLDADDYDI